MVRASALSALLVGLALAACGDRPGPTLTTSDVAHPPRAEDRSCVAEDPAGGGPRTWRVERGDTLATIAHRTYGRADLAREIERANPGSVRNGKLTAGTVLLLPDVR